MADNTSNPGLGVTFADDDISSVKYPRMKVAAGVDGTYRRDVAFESTPYHLISAATNNATSLKASAGHLCYVIASNVNAAVRYLKFYNKATAPNPASDTPVLVVPLPPSSAFCSISFGENPVYFSTGIAFAIVTGIGDSDNTATAASEQNVNMGYL